MPWISPYLIVKDVDAAVTRYAQAFEFQPTDEIIKDDTGKTVHAKMEYKSGVVMMGAEGAFGKSILAPISQNITSPVGIYVYCQDVDQLFQRATELGMVVTQELEDMFWGDRMCAFTDPDGHRWSFATQV